MTSAVVITGAGSGIGRAIAQKLAERGWLVVATDVNADAAEATRVGLPAAETGSHESAVLDVTDVHAANALAVDVGTRLGLGGWVNNAGVSFMKRFVDIEMRDYETSLDVNLKGVFVCGQAAARVMQAAGGGRIVNIASMAGKQGRVPYLADYVASKFGVVGLTQAMAFELGSEGIRVNAVCPGYVSTPMQERELQWEATLRGSSVPGVRQMMIDDTPLGRLQDPRDVAKTVAFLLSEDADFITGEAIAVNGGAYMD